VGFYDILPIVFLKPFAQTFLLPFAMESLTKKTLKNSRSFTYTYYVSRAQSPLPTVLLIHGCPDSANLWSDLVMTYLQPGGYGVVAVDDLGYGGSSKPTDSAAYALNLMVKDLCEVLDTENLEQVISLGHDWGSILAQRLYNCTLLFFFKTRVCVAWGSFSLNHRAFVGPETCRQKKHKCLW
jgi:hypothetical protein